MQRFTLRGSRPLHQAHHRQRTLPTCPARSDTRITLPAPPWQPTCRTGLGRPCFSRRPATSGAQFRLFQCTTSNFLPELRSACYRPTVISHDYDFGIVIVRPLIARRFVMGLFTPLARTTKSMKRTASCANLPCLGPQIPGRLTPCERVSKRSCRRPSNGRYESRRRFPA